MYRHFVKIVSTRVSAVPNYLANAMNHAVCLPLPPHPLIIIIIMSVFMDRPSTLSDL